MNRRLTKEDEALLAELGVEPIQTEVVRHTPREERIFAGFAEIQRFVETHGHNPRHDEDSDILERLYAVRLDCLRAQDECRDILAPLDRHGLLRPHSTTAMPEDEMDDEALLNELVGDVDESDIIRLQHVRPKTERRLAEEIATRRECPDFDTIRPLFDKVQDELDAGHRVMKRFRNEATIERGHFFVLGGQKVFVAQKGEVFRNAQDRPDARLRLVFDNGTESNLLMRSLERALQKDETGRRIVELEAGPLFDQDVVEDDVASGTIYVLRSKSNNKFISENRQLVHKIGVTTGKVEARIAGASLDPTFLMAPVEHVENFELYNINHRKLEGLIHRVFDSARLEIEFYDRFGNPYVPREWFLVPLNIIREAVEKIRDGTIIRYQYDRDSATFVERPC